MTTLNPYLNFDGNCEEAFNFYKSVFGGEFATVMRYTEMPAEFQMPESEAQKIMHMALPIGQSSILMGSDTPASMGPTPIGGNVSISISAASEAEATRLFNGLSAGGQVTMPLDKAFWGDYFGMLTDKFGVQWLVSYSYNQQR
ncbi:MAG: VOC family protein [Anaerolineae bacterium]|nr:VOC family protein [Anaerolineales bacterium]MCQ3978698.1 VOC family protein [Anaerolineae bacterium]